MPANRGAFSYPTSERGYSLVELMVAVTITLFIMAGVYGLMLQNQQIYETQTRMTDIQQMARVALDQMAREIRMAGADPSGNAFKVAIPFGTPPPPTIDCTNAPYQRPVNADQPAANDVAPITVALAQSIRIKLDRPTFALGPEPTQTPTPVPNPPPKQDLAPKDGLYSLDDEDQMGDGFIDDADEDIEYHYDTSTKKLFRKTVEGTPAAACRAAGSNPIVAASDIPIAENVVEFQLKYYDTDPPTTPCPTTPVGDYETNRDTCDPPMDNAGHPGGPLAPATNMTKIKRVRVRIVVESPKLDQMKKKNLQITLTSDVTIRNRV